ncbi:MAG: hydroxymethylglutaryl-CoA reductase (NADPH) [Halolamina sp.]|uniref:hydroxymethylglutaryl-CoA reductase (NADPH) n=1 Tax=Halolamina sp. TaxID=1940283 RepID=UPI002FC2BBFF
MSDYDADAAEELAERVRSGDRRLYELEDYADADTAAATRRRLVEEHSGADLETTADYSLPAGQAAESNIENMIGAAQIPMGVAGPVTVNGGAYEGETYLPLATTEGALLASVNRGCSVIDDSGGAEVRVTKRGMTRAPVFRVSGIAEAEALAEWARDNVEQLRATAESTTSHGTLLDVTPYVVADSVHLRFRYDTADAMGMNMATIATREAAEVVEDETDASLVALSGNMCTDKKPAAINAVEGRGRSVTAEVSIPREAVESTLKTSPEAISEVNTRKNLLGSAKAASLGFNAQAANVVAAMYLATGQDAAQVVEGSNGIVSMEAREDGLYGAISLSSIEVGTVGGGTKLPTQAEGLDILGIRGSGDPAGENGDALAECVAVGALAGELSLLSALASRHLSSAHAELGR